VGVACKATTVQRAQVSSITSTATTVARVKRACFINFWGQGGYFSYIRYANR